MKVRAKFHVVQKTEHASSGAWKNPGGSIKLSPVAGAGNEDWSKWTPSGQIEMQITNQSAFDAFETGKSYFVEFTPCEVAPN